jgi:hypothetical protein
MKKKSLHSAPDSESGNILIYIIGAIFLIGLLTIMLKGSNTPGSGIDREELILKASKVRAYASELERGVTFVLRNGTSEIDLSFAHPNHSSAYGTYGSNPTAEIFHPNGGGVEWRDNDADLQITDSDWIFSGANNVYKLGVDSGSEGKELIAFLPDVTLDFCEYILDTLNITYAVDDTPPKDNDSMDLTTLFDGTFESAASRVGSDYRTDGETESCIEDTTTNKYYYFKVLMIR